MKDTRFICFCNRCHVLMDDENPSEESFDFIDEDLHVLDIKDQLRASDGHVICPVCEEDSALFDVTSKEQLKSIKMLLRKE